ncbi:hypothetical protein E1301_Tti018533 [Triplophysa tibetana]|uniref:Uncharacterized protein n=1 Tax=Triplophysa tibetana TaxID=1572043 RepID=A0A5A9MTU5_9TELE|nr:hypothetical protein E1301_Tti018533 [Triplophysa tibetana]
MERGHRLAQAISDMQREIRQLEGENKGLRGQLDRPESDSLKSVSSSPQHKDGAQEMSSHGHLRRNLSAPILEGQFKENIIMTVRRYSISSNIMNAPQKNEILHKPRRYEETINNNKWARLHDGLHGRPSSAYSKPDIDKLTNRHSLQEYGNKSRQVEL